MLLMLLMLVLPVQTFASAIMLGCLSAHPATLIQAVSAEEAMVVDPGIAVGSSMATCHEPATQHKQTEQQSTCKHCAVCALASALAGPVMGEGMSLPESDRYQPAAAARFSGFIPDGPERPPQAFLA